MFFSRADDIYDVFLPLHIISRSIGLTSFSLKTEKGKIKASATCLSLCIIITTTVLNLVLAHRFVTKTDEMWIVNEKVLPKIFIDAMYCLVLTLFFQTIILQVWTFSAMGSFARVLNLMLEIDNELSQQFMFQMNYTKQRKYFIGCSLVAITFIALLNIFSHFSSEYHKVYKLSALQSFSLGFCMITSTTLMCQFYLCVWSIRLRFQKINFLLKESFKSWVSDYVMKEKLKRIANVHDLLVDVTDNINKCFGVPVSWSLTVILNKNEENATLAAADYRR